MLCNEIGMKLKMFLQLRNIEVFLQCSAKRMTNKKSNIANLQTFSLLQHFLRLEHRRQCLVYFPPAFHHLLVSAFFPGASSSG